MYTIHKLKPDRSITGLFPVFSALIIMALIGIFFGIKAAFTFLAIFYWGLSVYTFIGFLRTSNANFIIPALFQFFAGFVAYTFEPKSSGNSPPFLMFAVLLMFVFEPAPGNAYDSVVRLQQTVLFGTLIRSVHHWSANLLIVVWPL